MASEAQKYQSPSKKVLEDLLAKHRQHLSPEICRHVQTAITGLDHTDPREVVKLLPAPVLAFYQHTVTRSFVLTPLIAKAHAAGCYIESIVLSHGLIQFALRALYVLAWQRSVLPSQLSENSLAPYYKQNGGGKGDVFRLIETLENNEVIQDFHAAHLRNVNQIRNKAAHGVIFGEIEPQGLLDASATSQHAALGAVETLKAWFNNPRPLRTPPAP
jgi:hypothetical protein